MDQNNSKPIQVAVVGAGYISEIHMQVFSLLEDVHVCAVCDSDIEKAKISQKKWNIPHVFSSIDEMLKKLKPDVAQLIVPPVFHAQVAEKFLNAGVSIFLEKPMALSVNDCQRLVSLSKSKNLSIGINHNYLYHPAYQKMLKDLQSRRIGRLQHVIIVNNMPLRQLSTKDFSHWMFQDPRNIIFEQGPHPFSMIYGLLGRVNTMQTTTLGKHKLTGGKTFYDTWQISMECEKGSAQLYYAVGKEFPENRLLAIGQDGSIHIDLLNNLYSVQEKTSSEYFSPFLTNLRNSYLTATQSTVNTANYLLSVLKVRKPADPFFMGMKGSIEAFYQAFRKGIEPLSAGDDGLAVIEYCDKATAHIPSNTLDQAKVIRPPVLTNPVVNRNNGHAEVLVIGATGFIGEHLVRALLKAGHKIRVMARKPESVSSLFRDPHIQVVKGDMTNRESVFKAICGVSAVYHLATGSGKNWEEVRGSMIGGLKNVADGCIEEKVEKFFFTSTVAVYPFDGNDPITEESPLDQHPEERSLYCRAKIASEKMLWEMHHSFGLPVTIFRPAVVIGEGGIAEHSAVGFWVNDLHCIGWGSGKFPLPLVLVEDVAAALVNGLASEDCIGKSFNLAGDIRFTAQEYIRHLRKARQRNICFHSRSINAWYLSEIKLWALKKLIGRSDAQLTIFRDLKARSLQTPIDSTKSKRLLSWKPEKDVNTFIRQGIECYQ